MTEYTDLSPIAVPLWASNPLTVSGNVSEPGINYNYNTYWIDLNNLNAPADTVFRVLVFINYSVTARPITIINSDTDNTTIELFADNQQNLLASLSDGYSGPTPIPALLTTESFMSVYSTITAIRVTNTGSGSISTRIAA